MPQLPSDKCHGSAQGQCLNAGIAPVCSREHGKAQTIFRQQLHLLDPRRLDGDVRMFEHEVDQMDY